MDKELKKEALEWTKEIIFAALIISIIMGSLYAYTGRWPPLVVVESGSMQHSDDTSYIGVIDTGDIVLAKQSSFSDITTYAKGRGTGYSTYGDYGDVIIYRRYGQDSTPIIHRAILYLKWNKVNHSFDAPDLKYLEEGKDYVVNGGDGWHNITGTITIFDYGYAHRNLAINIASLISRPNARHDGYITGGDHNIARNFGIDQPRICAEPVRYEWVVGKAEGELPWFGIIKLLFSGTLDAHPAPANSWIMLFVSIVVIIVLPLGIEKLWDMKKSKKEEGGNEEKEISDSNLPYPSESTDMPEDMDAAQEETEYPENTTETEPEEEQVF